MKLLKFIFFFIILSGIAYAGEDPRKIHVTGKSKISLPAQRSTIHADLKVVKKKMGESHARLSLLLSELIGNLKKIGLTDKEIIKSIIRQGPEHRWENNSKIHVGYFSSCSMRLRVNDVKRLHPVYKELSGYDGLTIRGTEYGINNEAEARNDELVKALHIARKKAALMASVLGAKIGRVLSVRESSPINHRPVRVYASAEKAGGGIGGAFGMVEISASVSAEFELE